MMIAQETPVTALGDILGKGHEIFIKRDDLLPFSFGGNKVRIAEAFVRDMKARGDDAMIFYGDRCSNLCRVLANICAIEEIPAIMIAAKARGRADLEPFNSRLIRQFGVPVLDCESGGIAEAVDEAFARLRAMGRRPYYIYGNRLGTGNEAVAARAYAEAYRGIAAWEEAHGMTFDLIAVPYGTGATLSGLICGALEAGTPRPIVGLSISSRTYERAYGLLREGIAGYLREHGRDFDEAAESMIRLETRFNKGGYGLYDEEVEAMIAFMMTRTGIPMDPTYTAKAFLGLKHYLEEEGRSFKNVLFIHTGGTPLYFDYLTESGR